MMEFSTNIIKATGILFIALSACISHFPPFGLIIFKKGCLQKKADKFVIAWNPAERWTSEGF
jgi:hypothetical protein